jgi:hypothetical protein
MTDQPDDGTFDWVDQEGGFPPESEWEDTDSGSADSTTGANGHGGTRTRTRQTKRTAREILDAPDYVTFVRIADTNASREYRNKVQSMLKATALGAIRYGDLPDAAAIFHFGPDFAAASGQFAAANDTAAKMIDLLTAPDNPALVFVMTAIPFITQLFRNHQDELRQMPAVRRTWRERRKAARENPDAAVKPTIELTVPFTKRKIKFNLRVKFRVASIAGGLMRNSEDPDYLTHKVFSDEGLQRALIKQGFRITPVQPNRTGE